MLKELDLLFYGNTQIPLSTDCHWCHNFNYLCSGSVYRRECPIGEVKDMTHSFIALAILLDERVKKNHFLLARMNGFDLKGEDYTTHIQDLKEKIEKNKEVKEEEEYVKTLEESIQDYHTALNLEESVILELKNKYFSDEFVKLKKEEANNNIEEYDELPEEEESVTKRNEIDEDDLPF